jgi:GT2 family glycosyltransferase
MTFSQSTLIITVNYNRPADTAQAVASLARMVDADFQIVVIDNGSTDGSLALLRALPYAVDVIASPVNLGFAGGFNLGLRYGLERGFATLLAINNDVIVAPDMLRNLNVGLQPGVGIVAPTIYYHGRPDTIWSSGFRCHPLTLEMTGGKRGQEEAPGFLATFDVDYLLGCCMLFERDALMKTCLFDEQFYLYYEDLDLSLRMRRHGLRLCTIPSAVMWHKVAGSSGLDSPLRTYHMARSSILFFRKHARGWQIPFVIGSRSASAIRKAIAFMRHKNRNLLSSYIQGLRDGWSGKLDDMSYRHQEVSSQ